MNNQIKKVLSYLLASALAFGIGFAGDKYLGSDFGKQVCEKVSQPAAAASQEAGK